MAILLNPTNVNIEINDDIGLMCISEEFSNHAPRETYLIQSQYEAARAFFQAEQDEQLGRWRDPENADWICYPDEMSPNWVLVIQESTGDTDTVFRHTWGSTEDDEFILVADRYFAAHPDVEPHKPWHDAKVGEYWLVTLEGADPIPTTVGNYCENLYFVVGDDDYYCPTNDHRIQNAVRLTHEGDSDE